MVKGASGELTVKLIPHTDEGKAVDVDGVNTLLWAIGRDANMVNLGIELTKVEMERGFIKVDEYQNTSIPNMYALGDIAGKKLLTPGMAAILSLSLSHTHTHTYTHTHTFSLSHFFECYILQLPLLLVVSWLTVSLAMSPTPS